MLTSLRHHTYQMKYCPGKGLVMFFLSILGKLLAPLMFLLPGKRDEKDILQILGKASRQTIYLQAGHVPLK